MVQFIYSPPKSKIEQNDADGRRGGGDYDVSYESNKYRLQSVLNLVFVVLDLTFSGNLYHVYTIVKQRIQIRC